MDLGARGRQELQPKTLPVFSFLLFFQEPFPLSPISSWHQSAASQEGCLLSPGLRSHGLLGLSYRTLPSHLYNFPKERINLPGTNLSAQQQRKQFISNKHEARGAPGAMPPVSQFHVPWGLVSPLSYPKKEWVEILPNPSRSANQIKHCKAPSELGNEVSSQEPLNPVPILLCDPSSHLQLWKQVYSKNMYPSPEL